jgi:hypothetical protein
VFEVLLALTAKFIFLSSSLVNLDKCRFWAVTPVHDSTISAALLCHFTIIIESCHIRHQRFGTSVF